MEGMRNKYIVDTTLRDGEQAPGVVFRKEEKLEIAQLLDDMGIEELEVGTPAMGDEECRDIETICTQGFDFKSIAWCRGLKKDIDKARECGTDYVSISFPSSDIHIDAMGKSRVWVLENMKRLVYYASSFFDKVIIGAQDASRADAPFLQEFIAEAIFAGAERVRIADTVGIMTPLKTQQLFTNLSSSFSGFDFEFHAHNDLGMATANALTALQCGASGVSCTVNGLGERAGNAALEELIMAMKLDVECNAYNSELINLLCQKVAIYAKREIPWSKPVVGSLVYKHESGIHTHLLTRDKRAYQAYDEQLAGCSNHELVVGKHSGRSSIEAFFARKNIYLNSVQLAAMLSAVKEFAYNSKGLLDEQRLMEIFRSITS